MKIQPLVLIAIAASYANADIFDQLPSIESRLAVYETQLVSAYNSIYLAADGDYTKAAKGFAAITTNGWFKSYVSYASSLAAEFATVSDAEFATLVNTDWFTLTDDGMGSAATDVATSINDDSTETDKAVSSKENDGSSATTPSSRSRSRSASSSGSASASGSKSSSDSGSASAASDSSSSAAFGVAFLAPIGAVMGALALALM